MRIPSEQEIREAHAAIVAEGAMSEATLGLGMVALRDPTVRAIVTGNIDEAFRMIKSGPEDIAKLTTRSLLMSMMMSGLNLGLRIGEARSRNGRRE